MQLKKNIKAMRIGVKRLKGYLKKGMNQTGDGRTVKNYFYQTGNT